MNKAIDFLVIGAQKCATTWLYECLKDHPEICLPKHKKEIEYIGGNLYKEKGLEWYLSLLNHCSEHKVKGDVSVEYIINHESPALLYDLNPQMKFILSVRDPVERAISALKWYARKGIIPEDHSELVRNLKKAVQSFAPGDTNSHTDTLSDLLNRGLYNKLLSPYYRLFKPGCFLIIDYKDIQQNSKKALETVYSFLQVDPRFIPQSLRKQPKKNSNSKFLMNMEKRFPKNKLLIYLLHKLHQTLPDQKSKDFFQSEKEIRELLGRFYDEHKKLVNIDFNSQNSQPRNEVKYINR
jgi:hypothetical protein